MLYLQTSMGIAPWDNFCQYRPWSICFPTVCRCLWMYAFRPLSTVLMISYAVCPGCFTLTVPNVLHHMENMWRGQAEYQISAISELSIHCFMSRPSLLLVFNVQSITVRCCNWVKCQLLFLLTKISSRRPYLRLYPRHSLSVVSWVDFAVLQSNCRFM